MAEKNREPAMTLEASPEEVDPHSRAADNAQPVLDSLPQGSVASVYEIEFVAECLAGAYARMVEFNKEELGLTTDEAEKRVRTTTDWDVKRATETPADHITWYTIQSVMDHDPALGLATWERVKQAARDELETGHRAAAVFDWDSSPWNRAQFLAIPWVVPRRMAAERGRRRCVDRRNGPVLRGVAELDERAFHPVFLGGKDAGTRAEEGRPLGATARQRQCHDRAGSDNDRAIQPPLPADPPRAPRLTPVRSDGHSAECWPG
jgi:hypothetical protein